MSDLKVVRDFREDLLRKGRRRRRTRPLLAAAAAVVVGGGIATAATGSFPVGDPIPSVSHNGPAAAEPREGSGRLLRVRAADPAGGPLWGVREYRTKRSLVCHQVGRVVDGRLGIIGDNGVFREAPLAAFGCAGDARARRALPSPRADAGVATHQDLGDRLTSSGGEPGAFADIQCTESLATRMSFDRRVVICDERPRRWVATGAVGPRVVAIELRGPGIRERYPVVDGRYLIVRRGPHPSGASGYAVFRDGRRVREWRTSVRLRPARQDPALARRVAPAAAPAVVTRNGQVVVTLRNPRARPRLGNSYGVTLRGPRGCPRQGLIRFLVSTGARLRSGQKTRFAIRPPGPSLDARRVWCPGRYTGTLVLRGLRTAGSFSFEVRP